MKKSEHPFLAPRKSMDDPQGDFYGALCVIACTPEEDKTRQEYRDTVDVNNIIRNVTGYPMRPVTYGEVDFDALDRHSVENQLRAAQELYGSLSPSQRAAIPSLAHLIDMAAEGFEPPPAAPEEAAPPSSKEDTPAPKGA